MPQNAIDLTKTRHICHASADKTGHFVAKCNLASGG